MLIKFSFCLISFVNFKLFDMIIILDSFMFLRALIFQDLKLIL